MICRLTIKVKQDVRAHITACSKAIVKVNPTPRTVVADITNNGTVTRQRLEIKRTLLVPNPNIMGVIEQDTVAKGHQQCAAIRAPAGDRRSRCITHTNNGTFPQIFKLVVGHGGITRIAKYTDRGAVQAGK